MKIFTLIILLSLATQTALADESCGVKCSDVTKDQAQCIDKRDCSPKLAKKNAEIAALKKRIKQLESELALGNKAVVETQHTTEVVYVVNRTRKNGLSLFVPYAPTKLEVTQKTNDFEASTKHEFDLGILFQRDFDYLRASIGATLKGTGVLGLGLAF